MAIAPYAIFASDITALSTPDLPVTVETKKTFKLDRPLASGWLTSMEIQPGFEVYAAHYQSHEAYSINSAITPGFHLALNLGEGSAGAIPTRELYLPGGNFGTISFDEPVPTRMYRGEHKNQRRCGIALSPEWIEAGTFERFDDTGIIGRTVRQLGITELGAASPALLSAASRLFSAFNFDGSLAGLRREAAAFAFFAEAFAHIEITKQHRSASRLEISRIMRIKDMLDNLAPDIDVRLVDLATHNGMSVRTLCRHFRLAFGTTVLGYVTERRMETARISLQTGGATIDQAAHIAGFAHTSNFSAAFRRRYGYPPGKIAGSRGRAHRD